jgi:hypothetical protein
MTALGDEPCRWGSAEDVLRGIPSEPCDVGVRVKNAVVVIGRLWIRQRGENAETPSAPGQWLLDLEPSALPTTGLELGGWGSFLGRLGVHPVGLQARFAEALTSPSPIAVVVDTSAVYEGVISQIVRMRSALPLHLAVPDTTFMEVQTHLEDERKARYPGVVLNTHRRMPHRLFRRLRRDGVVLHFIRPPEGLVRPFGTSARTATTESTRSSKVAPRRRTITETASSSRPRGS